MAGSRNTPATQCLTFQLYQPVQQLWLSLYPLGILVNRFLSGGYLVLSQRVRHVTVWIPPDRTTSASHIDVVWESVVDVDNFSHHFLKIP